MKIIRITTTQNVEVDYELAGIGDRFLARLVDYLILSGGMFIALIITGVVDSTMKPLTTQREVFLALIPLGIWLLLCVLYDLVCEIFFNGQTVGKKAAKIRVISISGSRPSVGQYLLRWIFRIVDFVITVGCGAIVSISFSKNRQRIGDIVAGTAVIKVPAELKFNNLVFAPVTEDHETQFPSVAQLTDADVNLIYDVIKNFNYTRNSTMVYKLASRIKKHLHVNTPQDINEYQFLEIVVQDYKHLTGSGKLHLS